ncbi:Serine proteinase inhibitor [Paragonimus heterotremus]|uniref:Serine proteinase inhibitor n=1 Tax=Paragonimus heterotremus TaxID=100268 RepID=A0A8J4SSP4_9TREM|nr:Serine proteinase inhibitor [Paragonimus heterotremus]
MATENMIKQSLSQFTADFYDKIITNQGDSLSNAFVSPLSIYTAMVMTMAGADGKTKTEIESALRMWKNQFDKHRTLHEDFTCFGGKKMDVMMMHVKAHFPYEELTDWSAQAVRLPFKGTDWQMLIVLPWDASGLPEVLSHLCKPGALEDLLKKPFQEIELDLFLPKFKLSQCAPVNAKALLQQCGMNTIFNSNEADLTKLCSSRKLFVSDIFHKAVLEVDEEGATAAAATAVMMNMKCARRTPVVRVDRPFFIALTCASTVPVFIGHVTHPETN